MLLKTFLKRGISLLCVISLLASEAALAQGLERPLPLNPFQSQQKIREEGYLSQEEFATIEEREKFLEEKRADLDVLRKEAVERNRLILNRQNQSLREAMEIQKEIAEIQGGQIRGKAEEIQSRLDQAGERYVLYKDGKKVTTKAGQVIRIENEKVKDKLGNVSVRDTLNMQYNEKNQLVSYDQSVKDPLGNVTRIEWRNGVYWGRADEKTDPRKVEGKLSSYTETIYEPTGLTTTRNWSNLTYYTEGMEKENPAHVAEQLAGYRVESVSNDAPAATRVTELSDAEYLRRPATPTATDPGKEDDILLVKFHEKTEFLGAVTERDFFSAQYNENEQLTSYEETSTTLGVTTHKVWENATYDQYGRLSSFDEVTTTDGVTTERHFRDAQYNTLGQLISYTEMQTTLGVTTVTRFSDATYDAVGRLSSFKNVITENGVTTTQIRRDIQYNAFGQVRSYFEIVERLGLATETRRSNIVYDPFGRVFSYQDEIREYGNGVAERTYRVVRNSTTYNKRGQETGYKETVFESNGFIREITRSNMQYNSVGKLVSFFETVRERGTLQQLVALQDAQGNVIFDPNGNAVTQLQTVTVDHAVERIFRNAVYDAQGRMVSYEEEIRDSSRPDVVVTRIRTDQVYDANGRIVSYRERETTVGSVSDTATATVYNLNQTVLREKTHIVYNALGQEIAYIEKLTDAAGVVTERILLDAEYDEFGRMIRYKERVTAAGETITRERSRILFDSQGRAVSYLEVVTDAAGVVTTAFRKGTLFNAADLTTAYLEEVSSSAVPNEIETIRFTNAVYDSQSRLISFTQERTSLLTAFRDVTARQTTEYNAAGQVLGFSEVQSRYFGTQLVSQETLTRSNSVYNAAGNLTDYDQTVDRAWFQNSDELLVSQDRTTTLFRNATYDTAGRLLSFTETETTQVAGETATTPQIRNWTRNDAFDSIATVKDNWLYYGNPTWTIENGALVWDNLAADPLQTNYIYQGVSLGETQGYTVEVALKVEQVSAGGALTLFWKGSQNGLYFYFRDGSITNGVTGQVYTTPTSDAEHTYRFVVKDKQLYIYKDGVLLGSEGLGNYTFSQFEETMQLVNAGTRSRISALRYYSGAGADPIVTRQPFTRAVTVNRSRNNTYDAQGRLASSVETANNTAEPGLTTTTTTANITYDAQNRQTGYTQTEVIASVPGAPAFNLTRTTVRNAITYDAKNRVTGYHEERSSSDIPGKTVQVDRGAVQYDLRDQVIAYEETTTEINTGGKTIVTEQAIALTYNNFGDVATETTVEKVTAGGALVAVTRRIKTDIILDPSGIELHSVVAEENLTEAYQSTEYNAALRQFGSTIAANNPFNPFAGYVTDFSFLNDGTVNGTRDGSYMNAGAVVTLNLPQAVIADKILLGFYLGSNQIGNAYQLRVSSDGVNFDTVANQGFSDLVGADEQTIQFAMRQIQAIRFTPTAAVGPGGTFYLSEIELLLPRPGPNAAKIKDAVAQLDSLGLSAKYTTTTRTTRQANSLGQITAEQVITTKKCEGEILETTRTTRSNQVYNALGQVTSLHEETSTVMTTWQSFRSIYFYLTSPYPLSVNNNIYNYIGTPQSFDFNGHGHYVGLGHLAPTTWDIYQSADRAAITYNSLGQMTGYTESGVSRPYGGNYSLTRSGIAYNTVGEMTAFTESGQTQSSGSYNFTRNQMQYDTGRIQSYHESGANPQDGPYDFTQQITAWDAQGRPTALTESGNKNAAPYNFTRTNIVYNANELPTSWTESGLRTGSTYDVTRRLTRYNNMGQVTDFFEEGTRAGTGFWEITSTQAYDLLGRFFKNQTRSGSSPYTITFDGTRAFTFYDSEGRVSAYQNYYGPVFIDVTGIQYDSFGRIIAYTETTRGGGVRQVFNIQYDAYGRIISQQFTDTNLQLLFGGVSTQTFVYDQATGRLLESRIANEDFTAVFDGDGNQISFTLSARMQAFLAEQEARAKEAARERRRAEKERTDGRFAPKGAKVLSRTETTDKKGNRRITETYELTDKEGRKHRVRETRRLDADGNLINRTTVDNFKFKNERGKTIRARIASFFDSSNRLFKSVEKYKEKKRGGTLITKRTTLYDPATGAILKQKTKTEFKQKRSFGQIFGALFSFGLAGGIWAALDPSGFTKFMGSALGKVLNIAVSALAAMTGNIWVIASTQFSLSLAQTGSLKNAALAAAISVAAYGVSKVLGAFLSSIRPESFAGFGKAINTFGNNLSKSMSGGLQAGRNFFNEFAYQTSIRVATQKFSDTFGKKLGAFGTAAVLSFATAVGGAFAQNNFSPTTFSQLGIQGFADIALRAAAQGGLAEAFKNESGLAAQFAREVASLSTAGLDTEVLIDAFKGVGNTFTEALKLFDPRTDVGRHNIRNAVNYNAVKESSALAESQIRVDATERSYVLPKGAHEVYSVTGKMLYSVGPSNQPGVKRIYDYRGNEIGRAPVAANDYVFIEELPFIGKGMAYVGSKFDTMADGEPVSIYFDVMGEPVGSSRPINDGFGRDIITGKWLPGKEPEQGFFKDYLRTSFGGGTTTVTVKELADNLIRHGVNGYRDPNAKEIGISSPGYNGGRDVVYRADVFDRGNQILEFFTNFYGGSPTYDIGSAESSLTPEPSGKFLRGVNTATKIQGNLQDIGTALRSTVELNTYQVEISALPDGKDPRVTVYEPIINVRDNMDQNYDPFGRFADSNIRYRPMSEKNGIDFILKIMKRDQ